MPFLGSSPHRSPSGSDSASEHGVYPHVQRVVGDEEYAAKLPTGCNEKPLSEQLEPIAVIGIGCHLPGDVRSASDFWDLMMSKGTGQTPKVPKSRFNIDAHLHDNNDRPGSFNVHGGYFLKETLQEFDPSFFGITPIEAMWMDPQQRKLLEVVYESFESAGVSLGDVAGTKTAVFAACFTADFQQMCFKEPSFRHSLAATGVDPGILSNRISHVFNLRGPSIVVNTACSSSVYALHNASNALRNNECTAAVVAGVNLVLAVDQHMNTAKLGVLSPTSTCHTFDASADGYGRAEGVGAVYLKRLSDAVRDGDPIRAVIRSSATNSNGRVPAVGITHPNRDGQVEVITTAYKRGGNLDPRLTGYFECHGTGTAVGDPLEVHAVSIAMNQARKPGDGPLMIGAVKTNIGHSEAASGLSALIKGVLTVERGTIPPTRGVTNPSPAIQWKDWNVVVPVEPSPFPDVPVKRVSINSFGYGGTNAHIIVESADLLLSQKQSYKMLPSSIKGPKSPRGAFKRNRNHLLLFSAHDKAALQRNFDVHAEASKSYDLLDMAYTLGNRRTAFASRGFTVVSPVTQRETSLGSLTVAESKKPATIGYVFTGQGAQWARMGAELMTYYPSFLHSIRRLDLALEELENAPDWTLEDTLLLPDDISPVNEAEYSQPLTTAVQIALVQLLREWDIHPTVTVGHSSGEIAASYAAGYISASEAIIFAYYRGLVVREVSGDGAMLAVGLGAEAIEPYLAGTQGKVLVACHNSPSGVTLSGDASAIVELQEKLNEDRVFARQVKTGGKAYHSHHMELASAQYESMIRRAKTGLMQLDMPLRTDARMVSSVSNSVLGKDALLDESYFSNNLKQPVLFNQALHTILADPQFANVNTLIEIGPHSAMAGPIRQIKTALGLAELEYLPSLLRGQDAASQMLKLAGELFLRHYPLDIDRVTAEEKATESGKILFKRGNFIVDLPSYQWAKKLYWAEARHSDELRHPKYPRHDLLGSLVPGGSLLEPMWRNVLRIRDVPWLRDHSLGGEAVFPAAGYFSMAMEAITQLTELSGENTKITNYVLRDVAIKKALVTPDDDTGIEVILTMRRTNYQDGEDGHTWWNFNVSSINPNGELNNHMGGTIAVNARTERTAPRSAVHLSQRASGREWNRALRSVGFDYGPTFADMTDIMFNGTDYLCRCKTQIKTTAGNMEGESRHVLHPATVDSCLQLMIASIYAGRTQAMAAAIAPTHVDEVSIWVPEKDQLGDGFATAWTDERGLRSFICGNQLVAANGQVLMEMSHMRGTLYEAAIPQSSLADMKSMPYGSMAWKVDVDSVQTVQSVDEFLELAVFKDPAVKILDITGSVHTIALEVFPEMEYTALLSEDIANTSDMSGFKNTKVVVADDDKGLLDQGLKLESFNIAIVKDNNVDVAGVRQLLSAGGKLLMISGETISIEHGVSAAGAGESRPSDGDKPKVQIVYREADLSMLERVQGSLARFGHSSAPTLLTNISTVSPNAIVLDLSNSVLPNLTSAEFDAIKKLTDGAQTLLWATSGGLLSGQIPEAGMVSGLLRVIRAEQASISAVSVDFDPQNTTTAQAAEMIAEKVSRHIEDPSGIEHEYCVSNGQTYISRLVPNEKVNAIATFDKQGPQEMLFDPGMRLKGQVQSGRVLFSQVGEGLNLAPGAVEVLVAMTGMNQEDIQVINGSDISTIFSHEMGGVVQRIGDSVQSVAVGDRVVGFSFDHLSTHQIVSERMIQKLDEEDSMAEMVSLPMAYATALHGLRTLAGVQRGERVLILEGTGPVSGAAIEVSYLLGAIPYVATASKEEAELVTQRFRLGRDQVFSSNEGLLSFLRRYSHGSDIDVVFSSGSTAESAAREAWRTISPFGRYLSYGRKNVLKRNAVDPVPFHRGANYYSFDVADLYKLKPAVMSSLLAETVKLYRERRIAVPQHFTVRNLAEVDSAVSCFQDGFRASKTLLEYKASEEPIHVTRVLAESKLASDGTYLLVGCLGGLGRSLTMWMMKKGARNFCFLSRSGADARDAAVLVKDLESAGAVVKIVRGDVSVRADVEQAISGISSQRPLRGVIHAAMVLRDAIFSGMTFQDWETSIKPKVHGASNLQAVLGNQPLDFWIMTSSVSGILGTPSQANYAAGNAYLDALARHRRTSGLNACAAILPMVLGVGVVAENAELEASLTRKGMYGIDEEHLLRSLELAINLQQPDGNDDAIDHLVIGLDPAVLSRAVKDAGNVEPFYMGDERFRTLIHHMSGSTSLGADAGGNVLASMLSASSPDEAVQLARNHIVGKLSRMLLLDLDVFEGDVGSIASYGIDSMIGAELRNWIFKEFQMDVPFQQLLGPTLTAVKLGQSVCGKHGILGVMEGE
ncbi:reducing type I polyketide synthase [Clathrospora elynae]|uniref:Reducing type I polyketide synthase n=1 Tax=Clathrospora elynae TaxID=706981 RepID=A0A6A5S2J7_9PLEO|nr:reducing type I polyketide synthase [Clathrospora elynae]